MDRLVKQTLLQLPPREFLDRLTDLAFVCSHDGSRLEYINPAAVELIGASRAQLSATSPWWKNAFENSCHSDLGQLISQLGKTPATSEFATVTLSCRTLGGALISMEVHSAFSTSQQLLILARSSLIASDAERALQQTRARFRSIMDSLSINLILKDEQRRRIYANRAFLNFRGYQLADIVGKRDEDLYPPDLAQHFARDDEYVMATGKVIHKFEENVDREGQRTWMEIIKGPLLDADGQVSGVQILFWDATARKETEEALKRERALLHALLDNVPDSIYFKDRKSRFVRISRGMAKKFNLESPEVAIGKTDADIFTQEHAQQARQDELAIMRSGEPIVNLVERETWPDRPDTWCSSTKMPLYDEDGKIVGTFGISRDITELIQVEQQLREARDQAHQASRAKSEFLANMSHEIRTPMNGILGMAELLSHTRLTDVQQSSLAMIQQSAESLLRIINDILDFSKIEAGKLAIESAPFELRKCIGQAAKGLAIRAAKNGVDLVLEIASDVPSYVCGDAGRLRQIIVNLVGNAIKFTEEGSITIRIEVVSAPPTASEYTLHFAIADTGIGIAQSKQKTIFDAFSQADVSTTRQYGGTGLGLSISSQLIAMMGGKIWLESEVGVGSTFHFNCKMPPAEAPPDEQQEQYDAKVQATPILLIDHRESSRQTLATSLESRGFRVWQAGHAAQAGQAMKEISEQSSERVAIVVTQELEDKEGLALLKELVNLKTEPTPIPILLAAASQLIGEDLRSSIPALIVLQKPVLPREIRDAIRDALLHPLAQESSESLKSSKTDHPLHVLVAEDGEVNRAVLVGLLERLGHQVSVAEDGVAAVHAWQDNQFDAIFMDVQMPNMDGLEATECIRERESQEPDHQRIPIIAITAAALASDHERCLASGMDDYLSKPIDFSSLEALLRRLQEHADSGDPSQPLARTAPEEEAGAKPSTARPSTLNLDAPLSKLNYTPEQQLMLVETMHREANERLEQLTEALAKHDLKLLVRAAHSLASAAGLFEAVEVRQAATEVETAARSGDLGSAQDRFGELRDATCAMIHEIQQWLKAH